MDGQVLRFHLAGINNQNFLMQDEQTGTWWQQVTGQAVQGPLKGKRLTLQPWDELRFGLWRQEHPDGLVLLPESKLQDRYAKADWEEEIRKLPTVTSADPADRLKPRDLVVGVEQNGVTRAYPMDTLRAQSPVLDVLDGVPIVLVVDADGRSVRAFRRDLDGRTLDLYLRSDSTPPALMDAETGSVWAFTGRAQKGPMAGRSLERVQTLKDFWFDWRQFHPRPDVFSAGLQPTH